MQTATSGTQSKSRDLSMWVHHYILRAPCIKGQGKMWKSHPTFVAVTLRIQLAQRSPSCLGTVPGVAMQSSLVIPAIMVERKSVVNDQRATCGQNTSAARGRRTI